jgi:hypothetical protein
MIVKMMIVKLISDISYLGTWANDLPYLGLSSLKCDMEVIIASPKHLISIQDNAT